MSLEFFDQCTQQVMEKIRIGDQQIRNLCINCASIQIVIPAKAGIQSF
jgi:hypothetical protein